MARSSREKDIYWKQDLPDIEECETTEAVIETIDAGLRKYVVNNLSEKVKASDKEFD